MIEKLILKYKSLILAQLESEDCDDDRMKDLLIELESCNYMLHFNEDFEPFLNTLKFKNKKDKAKFELNTIQAAVNNLPWKEDHEYKFKKACRKTLTWLFWTLKSGGDR